MPGHRAQRFDRSMERRKPELRPIAKGKMPEFNPDLEDRLPHLLLRTARAAFVSVYHHEGMVRDLALYEAGRWYGLWTQKTNAQIADAFGVNLPTYLATVSRAKAIINESDVEPYLQAYALFVRKLGEAMNAETKKRLPDDQKAAIIKLFFENKRKYYRQYDDEKRAEAATYYWTCWEIIQKLKLNAPMARLAIALDLSHKDIIEHFTGYHKAVRWIDGEVMGEAHREFETLYTQMIGQNS